MKNCKGAQLHSLFYCILAGLVVSGCSFQHQVDAEDIVLSPVYQSGMVLHTGRTTLINGQAKPGGTLKVSIGDYYVFATADSKGYWEAVFPEIATSQPLRIQILGKNFERILESVRPGKWIAVVGNGCVDPLLAFEPDTDTLGACADDVFYFETQPRFSDQYTAPSWRKTADIKLNRKQFQIIQRVLQWEKNTDVPIGIIDLSWPGAALPAWFEGVSSPVLTDSLFRNQVSCVTGLRDTVCYLKDALRNGVRRGATGPWFATDTWLATQLPVNLGAFTQQQQKHIAYLRKTINLPQNRISTPLTLVMGQVLGEAEFYLNGSLLPAVCSNGLTRVQIPDSVTKIWNNSLAIRLFCPDTLSGFYGSSFVCFNSDSSFFQDMSADWRYTFQLEDEFPEFELQLTESGVLVPDLISPYEKLPLEALIWWDSSLPESDSMGSVAALLSRFERAQHLER